MTRAKATCWLLLTLSMALVLWIRVLPRSLTALEGAAERIVRAQLHDRMEAQVAPAVPRAPRNQEAEALAGTWIHRVGTMYQRIQSAWIERRLRPTEP